MCVWIDEQKSLISYYEEKARNGFNRFEAMWKQFEATILQPQTKDIMDARRELIMWAQNNGYDIYTLPERPNYLPDSDYSRFCTSAQTNCHPDYDYWEDSIILGIESHTNTSTGNLLTTTWGQRNHYNDAIKNGPNNNPYLGCTTVAMGQIMKYHMYPNDYSWSLMADNYATNATAVLLGNIHNRINWFLTNGTSDPISAKNAFVEYGYSNATLISHDHNRVCTEMNARRPVLMSGASGISGHSWVCCGKHSISNTYTYHLYTLSEIPPLHYERVDTYFGSDGMTYLYMNWGWEGLYDGWYFSDNANPGSDNFNWARSEIVNISY